MELLRKVEQWRNRPRLSEQYLNTQSECSSLNRDIREYSESIERRKAAILGFWNQITSPGDKEIVTLAALSHFFGNARWEGGKIKVGEQEIDPNSPQIDFEKIIPGVPADEIRQAMPQDFQNQLQSISDQSRFNSFVQHLQSESQQKLDEASSTTISTDMSSVLSCINLVNKDERNLRSARERLAPFQVNGTSYDFFEISPSNVENQQDQIDAIKKAVLAYLIQKKRPQEGRIKIPALNIINGSLPEDFLQSLPLVPRYFLLSLIMARKIEPGKTYDQEGNEIPSFQGIKEAASKMADGLKTGAKAVQENVVHPITEWAEARKARAEGIFSLSEEIAQAEREERHWEGQKNIWEGQLATHPEIAAWEKVYQWLEGISWEDGVLKKKRSNINLQQLPLREIFGPDLTPPEGLVRLLSQKLAEAKTSGPASLKDVVGYFARRREDFLRQNPQWEEVQRHLQEVQAANPPLIVEGEEIQKLPSQRDQQEKRNQVKAAVLAEIWKRKAPKTPNQKKTWQLKIPALNNRDGLPEEFLKDIPPTLRRLFLELVQAGEINSGEIYDQQGTKIENQQSPNQTSQSQTT